MFKTDKGELDNLKEDLLMDVGIDLRDIVAEYYSEVGERKDRGEPYDEARITFCAEKNIVGSEDWAPFIVNEGWCHGKFPNITAIRKWVRFTKDNGANSEKSESQINQEAYLVARKIATEGIIPTWFVDDALERFIL